MHRALTPGNRVRVSGGARACTPTQSGRPQKTAVASSSLAAPTHSPCPFVQPAGQRALNASIVVRIHGGQRRRRARLRLRFRTAGGPGRHRVAAPCAPDGVPSPRSSSGQSAFLVRTRSRVRVSAGALCDRSATVSTAPCHGVNAGSIPVGRSGPQPRAHALVVKFGRHAGLRSRCPRA
jgi:hypothetical protein